MKESKIYTTDDGKEFKDKGEALRHEKTLEIGVEIRRFLSFLRIEGKKAKEYERIIVAWESYKETGDTQQKDLQAAA